MGDLKETGTIPCGPEYKFWKGQRRTLPKMEVDSTVGAGLGAEDGEAAVNKLWTSGPEARPAESKTGRGEARLEAYIWVVQGRRP